MNDFDNRTRRGESGQTASSASSAPSGGDASGVRRLRIFSSDRVLWIIVAFLAVIVVLVV